MKEVGGLWVWEQLGGRDITILTFLLPVWDVASSRFLQPWYNHQKKLCVMSYFLHMRYMKDDLVSVKVLKERKCSQRANNGQEINKMMIQGRRAGILQIKFCHAS